MSVKTIEIKQVAHNSGQEGRAIAPVSWLSGSTSAREMFVNSLDNNWTCVPSYLLDPVTVENFTTYARRA